ncbi:MAG TPA: M90 family metallopeptidase [Spirochaetia bacterium]
MGIIRSIRRNHILRERLLPEDTWKWLVEDHPILAGLSEKELARLREMSTLFLHEKTYEGADGLVLTPAMREVIAVQACLPVLALGLEWYDNWKTIVVVPDVFIEEHTAFDAAGVVHEWDEDNSGESWDTGPVLLSWKDVEASGWGDGYNVIIHEAAHRLDLLDGDVNGRPSLHAGMDPAAWSRIFSEAFDNLKHRARRGKKRLRIDPYAIEDDGEFFAVASEYFFEQPDVLNAEYPLVYGQLAAFYRQDPKARRA